MTQQHVLTFISILVIFILAIGNIKYLYNLANAISCLCRQVITLLVRISATIELTEINHKEITKLNTELVLKNKRLKEYLIDVHNQELMNTGRLRLLMKNDSVGHFECDKVGRCVWVNQALADLFGCERGDMLGNGWLNYVVEEQRTGVIENWTKSIRYDVPYTWSYDIIHNKTKEVISVHAISVAIRDIDGNPILFCGSVQ